MMKLLFVYQFCTLGGVETVLKNRLVAFRQQGVFPHIVFLHDLGGSKIFEGFENIRYEHRERELQRIVEAGGYDFVIPIDTPQIYPVLKESRFKGILVTEVHTNNLNILKYLSMIGETRTRAIITPSRFEKDLIHKEIRGFERSGIPIYIIPNPISTGLFHFRPSRVRPEKKVIGWVGRLEKEKNWKHFLEISSTISTRRHDVVVLVIGGYTAEPAVKKDFLESVKQSGLIDHLKWVPYLQYNQMPGIYSLIGASGGCIVPTSILEPFGMTAIEAMACGCPVVASRAGGFQEIIEDGQNGFLFEVNNTPEAVSKIEILFEDPSERERLLGNGRLTVETNYSSDKVVEKYLKVLKEVAEQRLQESHPELSIAARSSLKLGKNSFREAVLKVNEGGKNLPMYETYVNYALTTNERGDALAHFLSPYIQFRDKSYLDIGTAYGGYLVAFAKRGCQPYLGIEINEKLIELCKLNLMENKINPEYVLQQDICEPLLVNLRERKFDLITCSDVLEHVLDFPRTLENLKTLLADQGFLYLEIPNRYHVKNVISDPHFGLFGITLLEKHDAVQYLESILEWDYSVSDYYDLEHILAFFSEEYFKITKLFSETLDSRTLDDLFRGEIERTYIARINNLAIPIELRGKLLDKVGNYVNQYVEQKSKSKVNRFYIQNWKILIQKHF
jgi:glycosyltransferase involved in cell wall biosynthesis/2-polyprenyl-3-methyl-5-hydroxy-6-metoxy-1,4-benzoquinol methylase